MPRLCIVLGDQLTPTLSSLRSINKAVDTVLMAEVMEEAKYVPHHKKKLVYIFSSMRQFADALRNDGYHIHYYRLDEDPKLDSFEDAIAKTLDERKYDSIVATEPGEFRVLEKMTMWEKTFGLPVKLAEDDRFICRIGEFKLWAKGKKSLRMEFFYREMRKKTQLLMSTKGTPEGDAWNFDKENRKPPTKGLNIPARRKHTASATVEAVCNLVNKHFPSNMGSTDNFEYATTRQDALEDLEVFISNFLPMFGDYQDAMLTGQPFMYHSCLSAYLNNGLLLPLEVCKRAQKAYLDGKAPLNAVEGFVRQIIGWREYVRGIYWLYMPKYRELNALNAIRPLPEFFWTGQTKLRCVAEAVKHTIDHAYSHHIQRLMITGNLALLAGLDVKAVEEWYLAVYIDAYEWVELPNTLGMALCGDGGILASKPYAASGKYINKMSNYCKGCTFDPDESVGPKACPFNSLYWNFVKTHETHFRMNQRMPFVYSTWDRFDDPKKEAILSQANHWLHALDQNKL